jgi:hypothetical protein
VESVREHQICQFARRISLSTYKFLSLGRWVRQFFRRIVDGVWKTSLLSWIVRSAGCDDDASVIRQVWEEEVEKKSVANVINFEIIESAIAQ